MKSNLKVSNKSSLVSRLERNQNDLLKLKMALSSYTCEPRTLTLFERCETLKHKIDNLSNTNGEIIQSLKGHKKSVKKYVERAKKQFQEFYQLQEGIEEYVTGTRNHFNYE